MVKLKKTIKIKNYSLEAYTQFDEENAPFLYNPVQLFQQEHVSDDDESGENLSDFSEDFIPITSASSDDEDWDDNKTVSTDVIIPLNALGDLSALEEIENKVKL